MPRKWSRNCPFPREVVNFAAARRPVKLKHETRHVRGMDVVAHLLALVAVNLVFAAFEVAFHQIAEETVQLDARMVGPVRQPPQTAVGMSKYRRIPGP